MSYLKGPCLSAWPLGKWGFSITHREQLWPCPPVSDSRKSKDAASPGWTLSRRLETEGLSLCLLTSPSLHLRPHYPSLSVLPFGQPSSLLPLSALVTEPSTSRPWLDGYFKILVCSLLGFPNKVILFVSTPASLRFTGLPLWQADWAWTW